MCCAYGVYRKESFRVKEPAVLTSLQTLYFSCDWADTMGVGKEGRSSFSLHFKIWHFPVKFLAKIGCFLSFKWVKCHFTTFEPPRKIHYFPPGKNLSDAHTTVDPISFDWNVPISFEQAQLNHPGSAQSSTLRLLDLYLRNDSTHKRTYVATALFIFINFLLLTEVSLCSSQWVCTFASRSCRTTISSLSCTVWPACTSLPSW